MEKEKVKCCWCDADFQREELNDSRFLGGLVCEDCDADEGNKTLGEIHDRLKRRSAESIEAGIGWVK